MLNLLGNRGLRRGKLIVVIRIVQLQRPLGIGRTAGAGKSSQSGSDTSPKRKRG